MSLIVPLKFFLYDNCSLANEIFDPHYSKDVKQVSDLLAAYTVYNGKR